MAVDHNVVHGQKQKTIFLELSSHIPHAITAIVTALGVSSHWLLRNILMRL
jgi:hypothetical protein